jgi:hypothetical protein
MGDRDGERGDGERGGDGEPDSLNGKFGSVLLKDIYHHYLTDMWGSHESMMCGLDGIYLTLAFFNGTDLIFR